MGNIPLPALSVGLQPQPGPMDNYAKLMQLKSMLGGQQIQQEELKGVRMDNAKKQREQQDSQTLQQILAANPGSTLHDILPQLQGKVSPEYLGKVQDHDRQMTKELQDMDKTKFENSVAQHKQYQEIYNAVQDMPDDQTVAHNWPQITQAINQIPGNKIPLDPQKPLTKEQLGGFGPMLGVSGAYHDQEMARREQKAKTAKEETGAEQSARVLAGTSPTGITADQAAQLKQGQTRVNLEAAGQAETKRHNAAMEGSLTSEGLSMAAQQFATTGVMPSLGRSSAIRAQIVNEAARLYPKIDLASNQAAFKANQASLDNVTKTLDTLTAFEQTGLKNLKQFTDLADKIPDTGVPWANTPVRMLTKDLVGSENMAAVEAARNVALREIARVTNDPKLSGVLSDSSRQEVANLIPQNATLRQIKAVANVLQADMANVHGSLADQRDAIKARIGVGKDTSQPTTPQSDGKPAGATHTGVGTADKKKHWLSADGKDLGLAE